MINVPATPASHPAIQGFRGRQPSSVGRFADLREFVGPAAIASQGRTARLRASQALRVSCEGGDLDRYHTNSRTRRTVNQVAANLPSLADSPILRLSSTARVMALGIAIGIGRDDAMRQRAGKLFDKEGFDVHDCNSDLVAVNLGPVVLYVNTLQVAAAIRALAEEVRK